MKSGSFENLKAPIEIDTNNLPPLEEKPSQLERSPSFMLEEEFEQEVKKIKQQIAKKKKSDEVPDMDEVLKKHKKKLVVRMKNYTFGSVHDIFNERPHHELVKTEKRINNKVEE